MSLGIARFQRSPWLSESAKTKVFWMFGFGGRKMILNGDSASCDNKGNESIVPRRDARNLRLRLIDPDTFLWMNSATTCWRPVACNARRRLTVKFWLRSLVLFFTISNWLARFFYSQNIISINLKMCWLCILSFLYESNTNMNEKSQLFCSGHTYWNFTQFIESRGVLTNWRDKKIPRCFMLEIANYSSVLRRPPLPEILGNY